MTDRVKNITKSCLETIARTSTQIGLGAASIYSFAIYDQNLHKKLENRPDLHTDLRVWATDYSGRSLETNYKNIKKEALEFYENARGNVTLHRLGQATAFLAPSLGMYAATQEFTNSLLSGSLLSAMLCGVTQVTSSIAAMIMYPEEAAKPTIDPTHADLLVKKHKQELKLLEQTSKYKLMN
jgi:hypothetical protein